MNPMGILMKFDFQKNWFWIVLFLLAVGLVLSGMWRFSIYNSFAGAPSAPATTDNTVPFQFKMQTVYIKRAELESYERSNTLWHGLLIAAALFAIFNRSKLVPKRDT